MRAESVDQGQRVRCEFGHGGLGGVGQLTDVIGGDPSFGEQVAGVPGEAPQREETVDAQQERTGLVVAGPVAADSRARPA